MSQQEAAAVEDLVQFLRFPSVSTDPTKAGDTAACADWLVTKLTGMGLKAEKHATPGHPTLQTTALVHDVLLRLLGRAPAEFENSAHLLNASARMMRQTLVDRARKAMSEKRGGRWIRDDFTQALELPIPDGTDLAELDTALTDLESAHERMAKVVELRYFVGLEVTEVAATLGITERTARRDWVAAREWLRDRLGQSA